MRIVMRNEGGGFATSIYGVMPQNGIFLLSRIRRLSFCRTVSMQLRYFNHRLLLIPNP